VYLSACRWGTQIDIMPDDDDARVLLLEHVPRASHIWQKRTQLASQGKTNDQRKAQLAAVDAPAEPTGGELMATVGDMRRLEGLEQSTLESIALVGLHVVVLALPPQALGLCSSMVSPPTLEDVTLHASEHRLHLQR
jgi:hypothetical protein